MQFLLQRSILLLLATFGIAAPAYPTLAPPARIAPIPQRGGFANDQPPALIHYPLLRQVPVSSRFGLRTHPISGVQRPHTGLDFAAEQGAPVLAAAAGRVVYAGEYGGYGNIVVLQHTPAVLTLYAHLSAIHVQSGAWVNQSAPVAAVGSTGASTGPHLHFELRVLAADGQWFALDPGYYLGV
jgi:murein DD-endopeptidase MepM/ murein hydrolase activator NlpD